MTTPAQLLFKKIVLHNKLMDEATVDHLLSEVPEPEQAIQRMIKDKILHIQKANPLLDMYYSQLRKLIDEGYDMTASGHERQPGESAEMVDSYDEEDRHLPRVNSPAQRAQARDIESLQPPNLLHPMVARLLKIGRKTGASDVHIRAGDVPIFRCAGRLCKIEGETPFAPEACERGVLSLLAVDECEHFLKKGDLELCYDAGRYFGRYRVNIMRRQGGVHGVFHVIPTRILTFEQLQLPPDIERLTRYADGLVLITGPRGGGKTATLAAMIDHINETQDKNITSIENPVEFVHSCKTGYVIQRGVGTHTKSFEAGIRTALREAMDVIAIDEMGDSRAIRPALTAAATGHLVFAVVSAPDAVCAIEWLIGSFPLEEQGPIRATVADVLQGIVLQRLVPGPDGDTIEPAVEILFGTDAVGNLIREGKTHRLRSDPAGSQPSFEEPRNE